MLWIEDFMSPVFLAGDGTDAGAGRGNLAGVCTFVVAAVLTGVADLTGVAFLTGVSALAGAGE